MCTYINIDKYYNSLCPSYGFDVGVLCPSYGFDVGVISEDNDL